MVHFGEDSVHPIPLEIPQQQSDLLSHGVKVHIVAKTGFKPDIPLPWLLWIKFPRMKIEYTRTAILAVYSANRPSGISVWQKAEVPPTSGR